MLNQILSLNNQIKTDPLAFLVQNSAQIVLQTYQKGPDFFRTLSKDFTFAQQVKEKDLPMLKSISLQCSGHGCFNKKGMAQKFINYFAGLLSLNNEIKKVKLKISGFDLSQVLDLKQTGSSHMSRQNQKPTIVQAISNLLSTHIGFLTLLQIRISNVTNCSVNDFRHIVQLGINREARQLTNLSFQFSDWSFPLLTKDPVSEKIYEENKNSYKPASHDRNGQPELVQFIKMLHKSFEGTMGDAMHDMKRFRLEISTWFYTDFEMEKFFFGSLLKNQSSQSNQSNQSKSEKMSKLVKQFHNEFRMKVENLILIVMPNLNHMQLDLRNWNNKFEMGKLKASLLNISNQERRTSLSQISKKYDTKNVVSAMISKFVKQGSKKGMEKQKQKKQKIEEEEQEKEDFFDFVVVV